MTADERTWQLCAHLTALFNKEGAGSAAGLRLVHARHFRSRTCGLLGRSRLHRRVGLWLQPCHAVHTFGMRFPLTVVFLDRSDRCLKVIWRMPPGRVAACLGASSVVECLFQGND